MIFPLDDAVLKVSGIFFLEGYAYAGAQKVSGPLAPLSTLQVNRFIAGVPMNCATNVFAGLS